MARMRLPIMDVPTRRFRPDPHGRRIDMRATLRASLRSGGVPALRRRNPRRRHPPLVIICDISGSMSRYSRIVLHFMHAVTSDRDRVFSFLFGTRLTNITRLLRHRDVDVAVDRVADTVQDWSGGTRIGHCLAEFNAEIGGSAVEDFAARVIQRNRAIARVRQRLLEVGNPTRRNFNDLLVEHRRTNGRLPRV